MSKENQNNRTLQGIESRYGGKYTKEKGLYTFTDEKTRAQFEKEAKDKGITVYAVLSSDSEDARRERLIRELSMPDCNGKCVKEQQKTYDDRRRDFGDRLCTGGGIFGSACNPDANHMTELIIVETDAQLTEMNKLLGSERKNYRIDSQERINRNYNNASPRKKQSIDHENVMNRIRSTGRNADELYKEGKITRIQYENYRKEQGYINTVNSYSNVFNNAVRPLFLTVLGATNKDAVNSYTGKQNSSTAKTLPTTKNKPSNETYVNKRSMFINDGTPDGTVKIDIETVGNSNAEATRITNTYTGDSVVKAVNKVTGETTVSKNIGNTTTTTTSTISLARIGNSGSVKNTSTLIPTGNMALISNTTILSKSDNINSEKSKDTGSSSNSNDNKNFDNVYRGGRKGTPETRAQNKAIAELGEKKDGNILVEQI